MSDATASESNPPKGCVLALAIMCAWYAACILAWCW
jgi:hypothetical protein